MRIDIISVIPEFFEGPLSSSIIKRAVESHVVEIKIHNLRDYTDDKHRRVDDYPFGGEAGMVLQVEPIYNCITNLQSERHYDEIIYVTPDGEPFQQREANRISTLKNIIILCGHYKGVDQRVRDHLITKEISIGDFVITGGELAAAIIADSVIRLLPEAISDISSALTDSFQDNLLSHPIYTRPEVFNGWEVPQLLLSGNTKIIEDWKIEQAMERTKTLRPDLWEKHQLE